MSCPFFNCELTTQTYFARLNQQRERVAENSTAQTGSCYNATLMLHSCLFCAAEVRARPVLLRIAVCPDAGSPGQGEHFSPCSTLKDNSIKSRCTEFLGCINGRQACAPNENITPPTLVVVFFQDPDLQQKDRNTQTRAQARAPPLPSLPPPLPRTYTHARADTHHTHAHTRTETRSDLSFAKS